MSYITVSADVDTRDFLDELDDDDLMDELERRGLDLNSKYIDGDSMREILTTIWSNRRLGKDYQQALDQLIYYGLGKVL